MTKDKDKGISFEKGLARLEILVQDLESEDLDLDKSLALFEDGVKLAKDLNKKLDEAEKKLEILLKDEKGTLSSETFSLGDDEVD